MAIPEGNCRHSTSWNGETVHGSGAASAEAGLVWLADRGVALRHFPSIHADTGPESFEANGGQTPAEAGFNLILHKTAIVSKSKK